MPCKPARGCVDSPRQRATGGQEMVPMAGNDHQCAGWATALGSQASRGPTDTNCPFLSVITA